MSEPSFLCYNIVMNLRVILRFAFASVSGVGIGLTAAHALLSGIDHYVTVAILAIIFCLWLVAIIEDV